MDFEREDPLRLSAIPRIALACLPTPLLEAPRLAAAIGGPKLWIKRDDMTAGRSSGSNAMT